MVPVGGGVMLEGGGTGLGHDIEGRCAPPQEPMTMGPLLNWGHSEGSNPAVCQRGKGGSEREGPGQGDLWTAAGVRKG